MIDLYNGYKGQVGIDACLWDGRRDVNTAAASGHSLYRVQVLAVEIVCDCLADAHAVVKTSAIRIGRGETHQKVDGVPDASWHRWQTGRGEP
jgi:hypothetical protein